MLIPNVLPCTDDVHVHIIINLSFSSVAQGDNSQNILIIAQRISFRFYTISVNNNSAD